MTLEESTRLILRSEIRKPTSDNEKFNDTGPVYESRNKSHSDFGWFITHLSKIKINLDDYPA
jgi:hypothetical protein